MYLEVIVIQFHAIFMESMLLNNKGIRKNSTFLSEIENIYFRFTKWVERDPKVDLNGLLARFTNNGETLLTPAALVSARVAKDILERNICVNYLRREYALFRSNDCKLPCTKAQIN